MCVGPIAPSSPPPFPDVSRMSPVLLQVSPCWRQPLPPVIDSLENRLQVNFPLPVKYPTTTCSRQRPLNHHPDVYRPTESFRRKANQRFNVSLRRGALQRGCVRLRRHWFSYFFGLCLVFITRSGVFLVARSHACSDGFRCCCKQSLSAALKKPRGGFGTENGN